MQFSKIEISRWQQFESVEIEMHPKLTIITGANGSGKTTILNLLAKHFGWTAPSFSTPKEDKITGAIKFLARFFSGNDLSQESSIGSITYSSGSKCSLTVPPSNAAQYQVKLNGQQTVPCFYIPSHRSVFRYQQVGAIPTAKKNKSNAFQEVSQANKDRYFGNGSQSSSFLMKNTLIGWVINGYGVSNNGKHIMPPDAEQIRFFEGFVTTLKKILPKSLGFQNIEIRNMEVVFVCNDQEDEFLLETASGGISALIDIAWQIYMYGSKEKTDFTVLIDEVENHLHPVMQRDVLGSLVSAFPNARFVVTTHSPLIVGSVKESSVYALRYNRRNKIESTSLNLKGEPMTATEVLDDVLGVSFTMPIWAEEELTKIVLKHQQHSIEQPDFQALRSELAAAGLEKLMPIAIANVLEK